MIVPQVLAFVIVALIPGLILLGQGLGRWLIEKGTGNCSRCGRPLPPKATH